MLHDERLMIDVPFHMARRLKADAAPAHGAHHVAEDNDIFGDDAASDACGFPDYHANALDVALHISVNPQLPLLI